MPWRDIRTTKFQPMAAEALDFRALALVYSAIIICVMVRMDSDALCCWLARFDLGFWASEFLVELGLKKMAKKIRLEAIVFLHNNKLIFSRANELRT